MEMQLRVGCEFHYDVAYPTPAVAQVQPRPDGSFHLLRDEWRTTPDLPIHEYRDLYGNVCRRMTMPPGPLTLRYDALISATRERDEIVPTAEQVPVDQLPDECLIYTCPAATASPTLSPTRPGAYLAARNQAGRGCRLSAIGSTPVSGSSMGPVRR